MNILKAFVSIAALADSVAGQTSQFGQLSTYSTTFSTTKANYTDSVNAAGIDITAFTSKTDAGAPVTPSGAIISHILAVAAWVNSQYVASAIPPNSNLGAFLSALAAQFPTHTSVWGAGQIINGSPSTQRMPDYISWHYDDSGTDNSLKLWFCDASFQAQYTDDYTILLVPPTATIDNLNGPQSSVAVLVEQFDIPQVLSAISALIGTNPPTAVQPFNLTWVDPTVSAPSVPGSFDTTWTAIVYGPGGLSSDNIKAAIQAYIAGHSSLTNWATIYPGLYSSSEFTIIPLWNDAAVPATSLDPQLYRSLVNVGKLAAVATLELPVTYGEVTTLPTYLNNNLMVGSTLEDSLSFLAVGNPNNINGLYSMKQLYPDFTDVSSSSSDWGRMSAPTQAFITNLTAALGLAETLTEFGPVPANPPGMSVSRVVRDGGKTYLAWTQASFTNAQTSQVIPAITWLILAKSSYTAA